MSGINDNIQQINNVQVNRIDKDLIKNDLSCDWLNFTDWLACIV